MSTIIEGVGLEKTFVKKRSIRELITQPFTRAERIHALCGVDVAVREGEIFGLLGPNGAGKTTLLKIFACLVLPDSGKALVGGRNTTHENAVKKQIGLVNSDERSFYWRLSGLENLRFFAQLYDVPRRRTDERVQQLLERVDMVEAADRPFSGYSSGMKQRMAIARAMLHDPPILLMDEPTRSLDPAASLALRHFILTDLRQRAGKTIVLASHNLHEVEALADRVAILVSGRIRQTGTVPEVRRWGVHEQTYRVELQAADSMPAGPFRVISETTEDGLRRVIVSLSDGSRLNDLLRALLDHGVSIRACDRIEPDLEAAFSRILEAEGSEA